MINGIILHHSGLKGRSAGFSLIEIMVALTIGLLLMAGLLSVVVNTNRSYGELNKASLRLENGRYAMQVLTDDIQHAGFYGEYFDIQSPPVGLPNPCVVTPADIQATLPLPVQGYNGSTNWPLSCPSSANYLAGTDILVIRRVSTVTTALEDLKEGMVYLQGRTNDVVLDVATSALDQNKALFYLTKKDGTQADIREVYIAIYFISSCRVSTCSASADDVNRIPTLKRIKLTNFGGKPDMRTESLIEGIENLQIEYGIDHNGDGVPNEYVTSPANTTDWSNVVTLRVHLLARSIDPSSSHQDTKVYTLGMQENGTPFTVGPFINDDQLKRYKRHVVSSAVRVTNPSSRRETP